MIQGSHVETSEKQTSLRDHLLVSKEFHIGQWTPVWKPFFNICPSFFYRRQTICSALTHVFFYIKCVKCNNGKTACQSACFSSVCNIKIWRDAPDLLENETFTRNSKRRKLEDHALHGATHWLTNDTKIIVYFHWGPAAVDPSGFWLNRWMTK